MSEPRKNHLSIDGGQVKEDEHVASYKPIPETDTEFRSSKHSLAKSREKISADGAEEKLLAKEDEAKIVTRVDMADAKYVVEDHRNGGAKIELDANKRMTLSPRTCQTYVMTVKSSAFGGIHADAQTNAEEQQPSIPVLPSDKRPLEPEDENNFQFTGLSKEELLKYAEDPFWVNVRWFMFILFWAMWLCMLAGAITIIIKAPKCAPPTPRTWFEKGPLVDMGEASYEEIVSELPNLQTSKVKGIFVDVPTFQYEPPSVMESFQAFAAKAKEYGIKVIVDLIPNYVSADHDWFQLSVKRVAPYTDYFVWASGKEHDEESKPKQPNNWVSTLNTSAWTFNAARNQFYLHQYGEQQPDLNFNNAEVVAEVDKIIRRWLTGGAAGVRLNKARTLLVNASLPDEHPAIGRGSEPGSDHTHYSYWRHQHTSDQPGLDSLLARWAAIVAGNSDTPSDAVFTLAEEGGRPELFLLSRNLTSLRPLMTSPIYVTDDVNVLAQTINTRLGKWPAMQLKSTPEADAELASLALLLPAAPVFELHQLQSENNDTSASSSLSHLASLRDDASVEHGYYTVVPLPARNNTYNTLIACTRWKAGHTGYVAVYNPAGEEQRANLSALATVPPSLTVHHMSHSVKLYTNYTNNYSEFADNVLVPPKSTLILSYVPKTSVEH